MSRKRSQQRSFLARVGELLFGASRAPAPKSRRSLRVESLESREVMAAQIGVISGHVFRDVNSNNTFDAAEVAFAGIRVQLYRDNGDGIFNSATDSLLTSATTDANGSYSFKNLAVNTYFVRRPAQTAMSGPFVGKKFGETVSAAVHPAELKTTIDDFTNPTSQTAAVDTTSDNIPGTSVAGSLPGAHSLGGEREIITNFTGDVTGPGILMSARVATVAMAGVPTSLLLLDATSSAKGIYTLVWDGTDGIASTTPNTSTGLGNIDLTKGNANQLRMKLNSLDLPGATVRATVYTDATHFSTASLPLLARVMNGVASAGGQTDYTFRFDGTGNGGFSAGAGAVGNADFTKVQAVTLLVDAQTNDIDAQVSMFGAYGPAAETVDIPLDEVDVSLVKTVDNNTPNIGDTVNFTVTVTNATTLVGGRATVQATGVLVKDLLLTDAVNKNKLTYLSDNSGGKFNAGMGVWNVGILNPGESKSIVLAMRVNQAALPKVINTAQVTKVDQPDPDTDDWTDSKEITPKYVDIGLIKTVDNARPNDNASISFTVTAKNNGTAAASNVQVQDVLGGAAATSFQIVSSNPDVGTVYNAASGIWTIPTLNPGQSVQFIVSGNVIECDPFTNVVSLKSVGNGIDINTLNNRASVTVTPRQVDIGLTKVVASDGNVPANLTPNKANPVIKYLLTANNSGPDGATGLVVQDALPAGLVFVSADSNNYNSTTGNWQIGELASGASSSLVITARLADGIPPSTIQNTASLAHVDQCDHDIANDSSTVNVNPQVIDLSVTKTVDRTTPLVGENVTWTMTVTNSGPSAATGVSLKDVLPSGVSFVSSTTAAGNYDSSSGVWTVGNLAVNQTVSLLITSTVNVASVQTNTIEVFNANQVDIDSTPNNGTNGEDDIASASITPTVPVVPKIDLSVTKTVNQTVPTVGDNVVFLITVTNSGPNAATGVSLLDSLPSGVIYVTSSTVQGSFNAATGVWTVGTLGVNASATLSVTVKVNSNIPQTNVVEVFTADQQDIDSTPNNGLLEDDRAAVSIFPVSPTPQGNPDPPPVFSKKLFLAH